MKTAFVQHISHEIRTPLNIITGFAQVISNREYDITEEDRNRMLSDISHNTNEITNFVNELLELSESESQSHYSKTDDVDIAALCHSVIAESENENPAQLQLLVESTLPDGFTLKSNAAAIHKILTRLMSNALKFTEQGSVTIKLGIQNEALRIEIEDTGIGILPEHQEKVFERFYKVDTFKQGIGLGLTVARRTAVLLDGTLTLDSSYTTGARFVLTLPTK
jgi:signal transduction histidine kinase